MCARVGAQSALPTGAGSRKRAAEVGADRGHHVARGRSVEAAVDALALLQVSVRHLEGAEFGTARAARNRTAAEADDEVRRGRARLALQPDGAHRQGAGDRPQRVAGEDRARVVLSAQGGGDPSRQRLGADARRCARQPDRVAAAIGPDHHVRMAGVGPRTALACLGWFSGARSSPVGSWTARPRARPRSSARKPGGRKPCGTSG